MSKRHGASIVWAMALLGCASTPVDPRPASGLDAAGFISAGSSSVDAEPTAADIAVFWRGFQDAALDALVERALAANFDLRLAQARLQEARANQNEVDASTRPGLGITGNATRSVTPLTERPGVSASERTGTSYDAGFISRWELDLFARNRPNREAASARVGARQASVHAAQMSVVAEVARHYLELRGLQQRLNLMQASVANLREMLCIVDLRVSAGRATQLDQTRARNLLASTEAGLPTLQNNMERTIFRIATLIARPPRSVLAELSPPAPLPSLPITDLARLPVGTPEQWLLRRPDLMAAERELALSTAQIGIARAELIPKISLSGLLGFNAATLGTLTQAESLIHSLGVNLSWTPFALNGIRARIGASKARAQQSLVNYEQVVALALEETEGAFSSYNRNTQREALQIQATRQAQEAARLARLRLDAGVTDVALVLTAERELLTSQDALIQAQAATAVALVSVYRTLGGGWSNR